MKKIFILAIAALPFIAQAQEKKLSPKQQKKEERKERINKLIKQEEEGALIFAKQSAYGIKLNTDGYGLFFELGKSKTIYKTNLYWLEIGERKHPKEEKRSNLIAAGSFVYVGNPFIFGKENNFYYTKLGFGQQRLIGGKGNKNGIAVTGIYGGGLSLGLLKPYYVNIQDPLNGKERNIKYQSADSTLFLDPSVILGGAGVGKGFNELKVVPGAYVRTALRFDYGKYNEFLSALEVGLNAEFYSSKIAQMARNTQKQFFFNAYVALVFGKRK